MYCNKLIKALLLSGAIEIIYGQLHVQGGMTTASDPQNPRPMPINYPRSYETKVLAKPAGENGYFDYKYVKETDCSEDEHHKPEDKNEIKPDSDRRRSHSQRRRSLSDNPLAILNGYDFKPEHHGDDCTTFIPCSDECCDSSKHSSEHCYTSTDTQTVLPTSGESTSCPTFTPCPSESKASPSVLPISGSVVTVTVTASVLPEACTTIIFCNPARKDCPNNVPGIAAEIAKILHSEGGSAKVNGTVIVEKNIVVSGTSVVSGQHANNAAAMADSTSKTTFVVAFVGIISAILFM